jgi:hypothetical protein
MDGRSPIPARAFADMQVTSKDGFVGLMFASDAGTFTIRLSPDTADFLAGKLRGQADMARNSRRLSSRRSQP